MKKFFLFDIDGTLIDSNGFHARAWEEALRIFDKSISPAAIRRQMGKGADNFLPEFLTAAEINSFGKELTEVRDSIFKYRYLPEIKPFLKVRELFKQLRKNHVRIALASSSGREEVKKYETIARVEDLVDVCTSADDAPSSKPDPDIFYAARRKLRNPPKESVLIVGDSPFDAAAATKAGIEVIGVLCGGFSERSLRTNGCRAVYADPADMVKKLGKILQAGGSSNQGSASGRSIVY